MVAIEQNAWRNAGKLDILHCLRAPVGGLFRHVSDLAIAQAALGHRVGVVCAATGDALTEARLLALTPALQLGLHRLPMARDLGFGDVSACRRIAVLARELNVDVLHGHGAKGGAFARLAKRSVAEDHPHLRCFYTPHGGSLHFPPTTVKGRFYGVLERRLETWTDGILFESQFAADRYQTQIGRPDCPTKVVTNGLLAIEFAAVENDVDAADFVFVGELRMLKGVDVALEALAIVNKHRSATAVFAGDGPDAARFRELSTTLGLSDRVTFSGMMPARHAFARGRVLLMPSRAESLPYIVLEAVAAELPIIATNVGGIPEIIAPEFGPLLLPGDIGALATAMKEALDHPAALAVKSSALRRSIRYKFTVSAMAAAITEFYKMPLRSRKAA